MDKKDPFAIKGGPVNIAPGGAYPEQGQASVAITFSDKAVLKASYWRLIKDGKAVLSSFDHEQKYGLPAPIDAIEELKKSLHNGNLTSITLDRETGDLLLQFEGNLKLQVFNFTSYEIWDIHFPDGAKDFSNYVLE